MERTHKIWGERWLIRKDSTHAVSFLVIKAGFRCSWHTHQTKYNLFVVTLGKIGIMTEHGEIILTAGQEFTTKPGEAHEFRAYELSHVIEEMFVEYQEEDIQRTNEGSSFKEDDPKSFGRLSIDELANRGERICPDQF